MSSNESGQTLLELVVVVAVSVMVVGALVFATIASIRNAQFAKNQAQATKLAQEAIEKVRTARDRNQCISIENVNSWNGNNTDCGGTSKESIWNYLINGNCEKQEPNLSTKCYFKLEPTGRLINIGFSVESFPTSQSELIPADKPVFRRAIILSDDPNGKKVTAIVKWSDFSGEHESRLTTILRNQSP